MDGSAQDGLEGQELLNAEAVRAGQSGWTLYFQGLPKLHRASVSLMIFHIRIP